MISNVLTAAAGATIALAFWVTLYQLREWWVSRRTQTIWGCPCGYHRKTKPTDGPRAWCPKCRKPMGKGEVPLSALGGS